MCNQRCAQATSPPSACECECRGDDHGSAWRSFPSAASGEGSSWSDTTVANIAELLTSADGTPADRICDLAAGILADSVGAALDRHCGHNRRTRLEQALGGHFLCSLFAALACLADEVQDRVPQAAEAIIEGRSLRDRFAVKVAVQTAWDAATEVAQRLPIVSQMGHVILYARVLALVTCPDPENHEDVRRCCFNRLAQDALDESVKRLLAKAVPPSWTGV